ncbi:WD domain containing protein [Metarhizium album ARSEF 1941]|uniref:WD domain containing protein n=1 Tax=Metarhizium album (strain ARSEF 1941) TaxID=1081103 RepID=A0A0B2WVQ4_METAS|nr:WD domain containing protein [Metarhizium album ARSEF 1941]KHN98143.1 WD domain containing protein [Metarhizium album ARSEF 1941]
MASNDDGQCYLTQGLISKNGRKHYRIGVRSQHWQLRSLISTEKGNIVYFPGGSGSNHVQRLNTLTHECETIKLLTFAPRCLVAENGWLCCGSETGEFVAIKLEDAIESNRQPLLGLHLDAETRHQLNLEGTDRDDSILALLAHARRSSKSLIAKTLKLAKDRVNCVTLWFPPALPPLDGAPYNEPVAVLANNDRTVVLVSLRGFDQNDKVEPLDVVTYPDFVNRAILSPDGRILVAILDDPYLYVHERVETEVAAPTTPASDDSRCRWEQRQRILLKSQRKDDSSDSRGSFAACFSPSGAQLAVGTQHGTISVFDTTLLLDPCEEPLITTFKSSRPESGPGAIRDMAFSPGPFDILSWTEDRGHIGFADARSNFVVRQIVDINVKADFRPIDILDRSTVDPRLLDSNSDRRSNRSPPSGSTRTRRNAEALETLNQPLTPNETVVLEAIQGDRRRRERARGGPSDLTWTYLSSLRPPAADGESSRTRQRSSSMGRAMGDILGSYREQRERQQERLRNARQLTQLAREDMVTQQQLQTAASTRRPDQRWMDRIGETVAAMRDQRERQDSSYLTMLEMLQARERPSNDTDNEDSSLLGPLVNQVVNRWEESAVRGTLATDHGVFEVPPSDDNTAGLAWTEDGRTL